METTHVRVNFSLPKGVVEELRDLVPEGERSAVVAEALRRELARRRLRSALEKATGAWTEDRHPELRTEDDTLRWLRGLRTAWDARDLGVEGS